MTKNLVIFGTLSFILAQQTGCMLNNLTDFHVPCDDPLGYYTELSAQTSNEVSSLPVKNKEGACFKLYEAIRLSMPGSKQQDDKKALVLLKHMNHSGELSESDQQFNNMLLEHVSQRQNLRNMIGTQDEQLKKTETQLDQLQNIEVEINKKERSVTSPIGE